MASGSARAKRRGADDGGGGGDNDFRKLIAIDLSSLERRFEQIFAKLEALETRMDRAPTAAALAAAPEASSVAAPAPSNEASAQQVSGDGGGERRESSSSSSAARGGGEPSKRVDLSALAREIESLRAAQLRLKIDHEVAQSTLKGELETVRHELALAPQPRDLADFRAEVDVLLASSLKAAQTQQAQLAHGVKLALSERELAENQWKSAFEAAIGARLEDLWSGLHATAHKLQESVRFVQTDLVKQEDATRDISAAVAHMQAAAASRERDARGHAGALAEHAKGIAQLFALTAQADAALAARTADTGAIVTALTERLDTADARARAARAAHDALANDVDTTLRTVSGDVVACQSRLQAQQDALDALDATAQRQRAELAHVGDQVARGDARLAGVDLRVAAGDKKSAAVAAAMSEQSQALAHHVGQLRAGLDQAAAERAAMKRAAADVHFLAEETQLKLSEVGRLAATTDLALARTAAEVPKLHALVAASASQLATARQALRDQSRQLDAQQAAAQALQAAAEREAALSTARFAAAAARDDAAQQGLAAAAGATQSVKLAFEDALRHQSNALHQLHTLVDSIAITESADGMDDKLARFALAVAELGLKLEHFRRNTGVGDTGSGSGVRDDAKAELAALLAKVVRFLGSGVAIDQNKYLLSARLRPQAADPATGVAAAVVELSPPQAVLEGFRAAKAALFCARTRAAMDQLAPVLRTNAHATEFRAGFARRLQFVLEFGLANLFPTAGRPAHPPSKRAGLGVATCIACDRPIDDAVHAPTDDDNDSRDSRRDARPLAFADDVVADEHRLRRQRLANRVDTTSVVRGRSGNSGLRPKSGAEAVHQPPGAADFVYRAGFRLPKPSSAGAPPGKSASAAALGLAGVVACGADSGDLVVTDGSSLEAVTLAGTSHAPAIVEVPTAGRAMPRPHTAPHRTKSLPRLESPCSPAAPVAAASTAAIAVSPNNEALKNSP
ncbi:hypothetical protein PybrP1_012844 [[Pythium] brassicae (nom. inval.)]|nr:hypothetical protein PybrP1_012844 [[Pythium] brassicae (nom. inval.)]